jgi:hypothetical protein
VAIAHHGQLERADREAMRRSRECGDIVTKGGRDSGAAKHEIAAAEVVRHRTSLT